MESRLSQQLSTLLRDGVVTEVDHKHARCRVRSGENHTDYIPWFTPAAGQVRVWSPPSVGEQVQLLCRDGDMANAIALPALFNDKFPAPSCKPGMVLVEFADRSRLTYDSTAHALAAELSSGSTVSIVASGGVRIAGNVTITGDVNIEGRAVATDDVLGGGVSLKNHTHGAVQPGSGNSGPPE
jgi:phage baseplate assembly protein V